MPTRKPTKTKKTTTTNVKGKHLVARSISLEDAKGKPRIFMDAGEGDGYATICLFGEGERSIQICTSPDGGLYISLMGAGGTAGASLAMAADERAGLSITDQSGRPGTVVGSLSPSAQHKVVLFQNGVLEWTAPEEKAG